ncbi:MAG: PilZ domain-containing protein [Bdellovibrionales bacterium]|nr:PilZ domain-containing protein [Bdellovibrionales bacterium]
MDQMKPIFIKGHLRFQLDGQWLEFVHQPISVYGVTGLQWGKLSGAQHFGKRITAQVRIPQAPKDPLQFDCPAVITREVGLHSESLGLHFFLEARIKNLLDSLISLKGFYPTDYVRKYPRIPSSHVIQTFPLRAIVTARTTANSNIPADTQMVFEVANLSPNGALLMTENQNSLGLAPGSKIRITLEPRGWFSKSVTVEALVCRTTDEIQPQTQNFIRYLGVKFSRIDGSNRAIFLELLKDILGRMKLQPRG